MITSCDDNGDGEIDYNEFVNLILGKAKPGQKRTLKAARDKLFEGDQSKDVDIDQHNKRVGKKVDDGFGRR